MDSSLDSLPPEILTEVISNVRDLKTLYHLVRASPAVSRVFDSPSVGSGVLDHVLESSMAPQVCELVRLVAIVRTSTPDNPPAASFKEFAKITAATSLHEYTQQNALMIRMPPQWLPKDKTPSLAHTLHSQKPGTARSLLQTTRRIAFLTQACLAHFRARCLSATPSRPAEHIGNEVLVLETTWRDRHAGIPYQPEDVGPPVWVEEQRVARGFWKLQLAHELRRAASEGRLGWAVTADEMSAEALFGPCALEDYQEEQLLTVSDYVELLQAEPGRLETASWSLPAPPVDASSSVIWPDCAPAPVADSVAATVRSWEEDVGRPTTGWVFVKRTIRHFNASPISEVSYEPFRQLGLLIWEREKLETMGLYPRRGEPKHKHTAAGVIFIWRSLLSKELLAEVEAKVEEQHGTGIRIYDPAER